jgi:xanthine dehydrogenase accessory factor
MTHFFTQVSQELRQDGDICLATIVKQIGSAPRALGTRFLVRVDGSIAGTIGGGRLEADVIQEAKEALAADESRLIQFRLKGSEVAETDMLCGGDVDIYLEPVRAQDSKAKEIMDAAARVAARGGRALMVTPLTPGPLPDLEGQKLLLIEGKKPLGRIAPAPGLAKELAANLSELVQGGQTRLWTQPLAQGGQLDFLLQPIVSNPLVYLFGGGHISLHLARLIKMVDFNLVVIDDRQEFANAQRFPEADEIWVRDFQGVLDNVELGSDDYVVIVTRGHIFDKEVLAQALIKKPEYIGMIGSRRKRSLIYQALEDEGFSRAQLERVHSPIGLAIGAETPEEIAVSVVAELIAERARLHPHIKASPKV